MNENTELSQYKLQATRLRDFLKAGGSEIQHAHALEAVAKMHGFPNYNTLKGSVSTLATKSGSTGKAQRDRLADALDKALHAEVTVVPTSLAVTSALEMYTSARNLLGHQIEVGGVPVEGVFAEIVTLCPDLPLAMLDAAALVTPSDQDITQYAPYVRWLEPILARCNLLIRHLDGMEDNQATESLRAQLRVEDAAAAAAYGLALAALENEDYFAIPGYLALANMYSLDDPDVDLSEDAAIAYLTLGAYENALDALGDDVPGATSNGVTLKSIIQSVIAVSEGRPAQAAVEMDLQRDGFACEVVRFIRESTSHRDAFMIKDHLLPFISDVPIINALLEPDLAVALARAALKDAQVAAWLELIAASSN